VTGEAASTIDRRLSEACATNIKDPGLERGHRPLRILGKGSKPAATRRSVLSRVSRR
jgi:hypothetical protein